MPFFVEIEWKSETLKKEKKDKNFIHKPIYPGGSRAFRKFISENLRYPGEANESNIEGTVRVKYEIDYQGNVVATRILSSLGYGCDEEAVRVIRLLKFQVPKHRKMKVAFHKTTNIHFRKPKQKMNTTTFSYETMTVAKKESEEEKTSGWTYTIRIG